MQTAASNLNRTARSGMYSHGKSLVDLLQVFDDIDGGIVLDPFCGAGKPAIAALIRGARVIATDCNPMGAFMTRVLARPLGIPMLASVFDEVTSGLEESASEDCSTDRNLALLAELYTAIGKIDSDPCRETLEYVFIDSLFPCNLMQPYSGYAPVASSDVKTQNVSMPLRRKEAHVIHAFKRGFEAFLACKQMTNEAIPTVRTTDNAREFLNGGADLLALRADRHDCLKRFGKLATHIFLNPPYREYADCIDFSEFRNACLGTNMPFEQKRPACPTETATPAWLLSRMANVTKPDCRIVLFVDPRDTGRKKTDSVIEANGYRIVKTGFLACDGYRGRDGARRDAYAGYCVLERPRMRRRGASREDNRTEEVGASIELLHPYLCAWAHYARKQKPGARVISDRTYTEVVPGHLKSLFGRLTEPRIRDITGDSSKNRRAFHSLCLSLACVILRQDGWSLRQTRKSEVEAGVFGLPKPRSGLDPAHSATAVYASRDGKRKLLVFFDDQDNELLSVSARATAERDKNRFERVALMITASRAGMQARRATAAAPDWQRGFFVCLEDMRRRCAEIAPEACKRICAPMVEWRFRNSPRVTADHGIGTFPAKVIANIRVGGKDSPYRKLGFATSRLADILPGQFIMTDTRPGAPAKSTRAVTWKSFKQSFPKSPQAYLKRPFGIHRTFYPGFPDEYLKRLRLPPTLATVMHTAFPHRFDVFYKVLPHGKGTNEMQHLRQGMTVEMLGPLGRRFDIRAMLNEDVEEFHVIGGGVGMAPLIFLVQALRFCGVTVKAFIGIESLSQLRYRRTQADNLDQGYSAAAGDVDIYVNDLKEAGLYPEDVYVSYDRESKACDIVPAGNHARGFVSDLYARYLSGHGTDKNVIAFACGPTPMMKAVHDLTRKTRVTLHVLMEKRMACGIGVCLSCVCKTKKGAQGYSKVCKDGPIFKSTDIDWKAT